jgi:hypothetical protein
VSRNLEEERDLVFYAWLFQAEEFRDTVHMLLEWLSEAEQTLRFRGALPDDTEALQSLIDTHKVIQPQGSVTYTILHGESCLSWKENNIYLEISNLIWKETKPEWTSLLT